MRSSLIRVVICSIWPIADIRSYFIIVRHALPVMPMWDIYSLNIYSGTVNTSVYLYIRDHVCFKEQRVCGTEGIHEREHGYAIDA